jgi:hypothetical protein
MADEKPLSDNDSDDRLKAALEVLGTAPGRTVAADTSIAGRPPCAFLVIMELAHVER